MSEPTRKEIIRAFAEIDRLCLLDDPDVPTHLAVLHIKLTAQALLEAFGEPTTDGDIVSLAAGGQEQPE